MYKVTIITDDFQEMILSPSIKFKNAEAFVKEHGKTKKEKHEFEDAGLIIDDDSLGRMKKVTVY